MTNPEWQEEPESTDRTLLRRLKDGQHDAATELYLRYSSRLQSLAANQTSRGLSSRVNSEEIVQSVFRTFFRRASQGQYAVASGDDLWRLFLVIALNKIRKASEYHHAKKRDLKRTRSFEAEFVESRIANEQNRDVSYSVLKMTVNEFLGEMREGHADVVRLRIEGFSVPEISEKTGRAKRTVERILHQFRDRLAKATEITELES